MTARVACKSTVHFSTSFFTTSASIRRRRRYSLADIATLGFAISFMTSASVALADCFLLFFLAVVLWEGFISKYPF
jgi:hypothetical protein